MKPGIFAKTFPGQDPLQILRQVRAAGFPLAHYNMACSGLAAMPDAIEPAVARAIARAADDAGVGIVGVSGTFNMIHPEPAVRSLGLERLRVLAAACPAIGARLITLCTGTRDASDQWRHHPDNRTPEAWRDLLTSMESAITIADDYNVELGVEPELGNVVHNAEAARRLIGELGSPRICIVLDPANLFEVATLERQREIVSSAIGILGERIVLAHAKDRLPDGSFTSAGKGVVDFPFFVAKLRSTGFEGPLVAHGLSAADAPAVAGFLGKVLEETL